ncbi:MAG TPA: hypothetical protein VF796_23970 [Humisphaera sp.]
MSPERPDNVSPTPRPPDGGIATNPDAPLAYAHRRTRPTWVRLALAGLPGRKSAFACFWACLLIAGAGPAASLWIPGAWAATFLVFAAVWYWAAITWVDRCDQWD